MTLITADKLGLRAFDANAVVVPGALFYAYEAGTTTPVTIYSNEALTIPHPTPLVANAAGSFPAAYVAPGEYKFDMTTAAGASLTGYPIDNVEIGQGNEIVTLLEELSAATPNKIDAKEGGIEPWMNGARPAYTFLMNPEGYKQTPIWAGVSAAQNSLEIEKSFNTVAAFLAADIGDRVPQVRVSGVLFIRDTAAGTIVQDNGDKWAIRGPAMFENRAQFISFIDAIAAATNASEPAVGDLAVVGSAVLVYNDTATEFSDATGWAAANPIKVVNWESNGDPGAVVVSLDADAVWINNDTYLAVEVEGAEVWRVDHNGDMTLRENKAKILTSGTRFEITPSNSGGSGLDNTAQFYYAPAQGCWGAEVPIRFPEYAVSGLPSAASRSGARAFVTDSNVAAAGNFGNVVTGGGANYAPVYSDGTNWRIG